jgi:hypothetical protein
LQRFASILLLFYAPSTFVQLATSFTPLHNLFMRAIVSLIVFAALAFGIYTYSLKKLPTTDNGTAATQAISLVGVRSDLLQIAAAERDSLALNGHCSTVEELISSGSLTLAKPGRDGYTYDVSCSGGDFEVVAQHPDAPQGSSIRYPTLSVDANMDVKSN